MTTHEPSIFDGLSRQPSTTPKDRLYTVLFLFLQGSVLLFYLGVVVLEIFLSHEDQVTPPAVQPYLFVVPGLLAVGLLARYPVGWTCSAAVYLFALLFWGYSFWQRPVGGTALFMAVVFALAAVLMLVLLHTTSLRKWFRLSRPRPYLESFLSLLLAIVFFIWIRVS